MDSGFSGGASKTRWEDAFETVDRWLLASAAGVVRLHNTAANLYLGRHMKDGWRVPLEFTSGETREFDILVGPNFPFEPPRFALVDRSRYLSWPHVEPDGVLCLLPSSAAVSIFDPISTLKLLLSEAVRLVEASEAGTNIDDFRAEFLSYWPTDIGAPLFRSLLEPRGPSRSIIVHRLKGLNVVAENQEELTRWLDHAVPLKLNAKREFEPALLVWLDQPMLPSEFPRSPADIVRYVHQAGLKEDLVKIGSSRLRNTTVIFAMQSESGPAFVSTTLVQKIKKPVRRGPRPNGGIERGFRPGRAPAILLAHRFFANSHLWKGNVERVDAPWVHGRDSDPDLPRLRAARIVVVGCGSLGGPVASALAQCGIGSLDLIDPESLTSANVGRHSLGASEIGLSKAKALTANIKADYPHIQRIEAFFEGWEATVAREPDLLLKADLVISTIGEWAPEAALNAWRWDQNIRPNLLFGWTEPHAVAGHAVCLIGSEGCFACGLSEWGEPHLTVSDWPNGTGQRGEPACGVLYQPYGPVEIAHVVALITEAAIDILLGRISVPTHRIWAAREAVLKRSGGIWSQAWTAANNHRPRGAYVEEQVWDQRSDCTICSMSA